MKFQVLREDALYTELAFFCPACEVYHWVRVRKPGVKKAKIDGPSWSWNLDPISPTIRPSLLVRSGNKKRCHFYIRNGQFIYQKDCSHKLKNKTASMIDESETVNEKQAETRHS